MIPSPAGRGAAIRQGFSSPAPSRSARTGAPDVQTLPLLLYSASAGGNYQIASITALILFVPSIASMLVVERFLRADVLAKVGR